MRVDVRPFFVAVFVLAVGVGCADHGALPKLPAHASAGEADPNHALSSSQARPHLMKKYVVGFAKGVRQPVFLRVEEATRPYRSQNSDNSARSVMTAPSPTPSPWCPASSNTEACGWLTPPSGYVILDYYCTTCTAQDGPLTTVGTLDPSFTPPPNLVIETYGCNNGVCGSPVICSVAANCQAQSSCSQYPSCYTETKLTANEGASPANVHVTIQGSTSSGQLGPFDLYASVTPDILDLDIPVANKVVSWPNPTPSTIYVSQEVQLEASPAADLTSTAWTFDKSSAADVVGSYALAGPTPDPPFGPSLVLAPSPVPTSLNPATFYWVNPIDNTTRHLYLNATANNVQGPLIVDVYYPVLGVATGSSLGNATVAVGPDTIPASGISSCSSVTIITAALHLGAPCKSKAANPKPTPGMSFSFGAGVPNPGGFIAAAQLTYVSFSGNINGTPVPSYTSDPNSSLQLDTEFPMYQAFPVSPGASTTATVTDSPLYDLDPSSCTYLSAFETFQDYAMFQATPRVASHPSIWIPETVTGWTWSGAAQHTLGWNLVLSPPPTNPTAVVLPLSFPTWTTIPHLRTIC